MESLLAHLAALHRALLMILCSSAETHFQGLQQGGRSLRLPSKLQRKLCNIEAAYGIARHLSKYKSLEIVHELESALGVEHTSSIDFTSTDAVFPYNIHAPSFTPNQQSFLVPVTSCVPVCDPNGYTVMDSQQRLLEQQSNTIACLVGELDIWRSLGPRGAVSCSSVENEIAHRALTLQVADYQQQLDSLSSQLLQKDDALFSLLDYALAFRADSVQQRETVRLDVLIPADPQVDYSDILAQLQTQTLETHLHLQDLKQSLSNGHASHAHDPIVRDCIGFLMDRSQNMDRKLSHIDQKVSQSAFTTTELKNSFTQFTPIDCVRPQLVTVGSADAHTCKTSSVGLKASTAVTQTMPTLTLTSFPSACLQSHEAAHGMSRRFDLEDMQTCFDHWLGLRFYREFGLSSAIEQLDYVVPAHLWWTTRQQIATEWLLIDAAEVQSLLHVLGDAPSDPVATARLQHLAPDEYSMFIRRHLKGRKFCSSFNSHQCGATTIKDRHIQDPRHAPLDDWLDQNLAEELLSAAFEDESDREYERER